MNETAAIAPVRKTVHVKAPIAHAFDVFTSGLTRWWPHDHGVGKQPIQKVLKNAGLVEERSEGVRRIYSLRREGLVELRAWLDSFWGDALEAFKLEAEKSYKASRSK